MMMNTCIAPVAGDLSVDVPVTLLGVQQAADAARLPYSPFGHDFVWPEWARTARIAGAYFSPTESDAVVAARLDELARAWVSVVVADSPLGEQYQAWVDDDRFEASRAMMARVVAMAHARGLYVVMYHTGLELISEPSRNPGLEHPEWAQRGLDGTAVLYNDVSNDAEHWLHTGNWDFWVHPCSSSDDSRGFRHLAFSRIRDMVLTGIDGLWVDQTYLASSVGDHHSLWPSSDPCSAAAFMAATGLDMPRVEDWDDPVFRQWVVWRHSQVAEYLVAECNVARSVNPQIVFLNENSSVDSGRATYVATDPASFLDIPGITTAHEVETIADRMDHGETGMRSATLDQWLAFRTMIAFARATDWGKPSWILTYGFQARDSARLAGFVLAEGANFYENKGPQMAASVGSGWRTTLFGWIAAHEADLYRVGSAAEVGLLYSPRNRDLIDTVSGEPYDVADSLHFATYRAAARTLYKAHVPFDVVLDTDTQRFPQYRVLIAPRLDLMSNATATALRSFSGKLVTIGPTGNYNEWLQRRSKPALKGRTQVRIEAAGKALVVEANTGLLESTAPAGVQVGLRCAVDGYRLVIVNTASVPAPAFSVTLRANGSLVQTTACLSIPTQPDVTLDCACGEEGGMLRVAFPAGIETIALATVRCALHVDA
jgi:hypothetical protein